LEFFLSSFISWARL